jgi:hypothetical protein
MIDSLTLFIPFHLATSTGLVIEPVSGQKLLHAFVGVGAGPTLRTALDRICNVVAGVGAGVGVLGILVGGLMHTQAFHDERAPETGKHIIKNSLYGIGLMAGGPMLLKMVLAL